MMVLKFRIIKIRTSIMFVCVCVCFEWTAYVGQILGLKRWTKPRFVSYRSIFHIEYWTSKYTEHCSILHIVVLPEHNLISIPFIADLFLHNLEFFIQFGFSSDWNWIRSTDVTCIRRNGNVNKSEMERQKYIFFGRRCRCHHRVVVVARLKCIRNHHLYFRKRFSCTFCQFSWYSTVSLFHVCVSECWKNVESPKNGIRAIVTCDLILVQNRRVKVMHAHVNPHIHIGSCSPPMGNRRERSESSLHTHSKRSKRIRQEKCCVRVLSGYHSKTNEKNGSALT